MISRLFLALAFVLIPFADVIVSFPEPVSGTREARWKSGDRSDLLQGEESWSVGTRSLGPVEPGNGGVQLVAGATQDTIRASGGDCTPRVDEPEAQHADTAAGVVQPKALTGPVLVPRAGNPEDADPPAAVRTTSEKEATDDLYTGMGSPDRGDTDPDMRVRRNLGGTEATLGQSKEANGLLQGHRETLDDPHLAQPAEGAGAIERMGGGQSLHSGELQDRRPDNGLMGRSRTRLPYPAPKRGIVTWVHPSLAGGLLQ